MENKYLLGKKTYYVLLVICTLAIITLLLLPSSSFSHAPKIIFWKHSDKVAHFIVFFGESWLLFRSIEFYKAYNFKRISRIVVIFIFFFGLSTEILQGITYNTAKRNFSLWDLFFDVLASIVAVAIINVLSNRLKTKKFF
ncbi:MAG: VanZ family protein [Bacteroidales bacterium]|nr:VanZ family protein [Bacteroidales bacterium]